MISQLFVGFIAYVIDKLSDRNAHKFQAEVAMLLEELQETDIGLISWYSDLRDYWLSQVDDEQIGEDEEEFIEYVKSLDVDQLVELAIDIRNDIMLDDIPKLKHGIVSMEAVFILKWSDGLHVAIKCSPSAVVDRRHRPTFDATKADELLQAFRQQLIDMIIRPGFDVLHDQVAAPCYVDKTKELMEVMDSHIKTLPSDVRSDYEATFRRFGCFIGPDIDKFSREDGDVNWLDNGGGF